MHKEILPLRFFCQSGALAWINTLGRKNYKFINSFPWMSLQRDFYLVEFNIKYLPELLLETFEAILLTETVVSLEAIYLLGQSLAT